MIGNCNDMIVLKGEASKATSPEVVYIDIQIRNAMVSVYLTNNKRSKKPSYGIQKTCVQQTRCD